MGTDTYPVSFYNEREEEFQGISMDALMLISKLTGIEFEVMNDKDTSWGELLEMLKTGQAALLSDLIQTEERKEFYTWPETPFFSTPYAFFSKTESPDLEIYQIKQSAVGVVSWCATRSLYEKWFPDNANTILFDSQDAALDALENDEIDLFFNLGYILYYQKNLREKPDYKANYTFPVFNDIFFGLNINEQVLSSIIDKSIPYIDTDSIASDWTRRSFDYSRKLAEEQARIFSISAVCLLVLLVILILLLIRINNQAHITLDAHNKLKHTSIQLEEALEQANAASRAKSAFLSSMSHEMRTPMNAIIGMTAIGKNAKDIERKNHALNKIGDASNHLLGVIKDVLDMAKIEADKLELAPIEFNFEHMLQKVMTVIGFRVDEKRQRLVLKVDESIPRVIEGDDQRLAQVITNLLANAVKFTPEEGEIRLDASLMGEADGECELRIEVTDSGIGISPEQQARLFSAFAQADSGISRTYGGTGLGLTISKRIVELMDGSIWVESELGQGAKFTFTVKVRRGQNQGLGAERPDTDHATVSCEFQGKMMLLAEDIEINREILMALLEDTGLTIECAENGKEAVNMIEAASGRYDIVFMDVQMPHMDGLEATRRIRAMPGHQREKLPVIAMTANIFKDDIEECLAAGMDSHIGKPLDLDRVLEVLRKHLK
jgi:signal transduction histidine kinase/ActR/RegA family two-component response regulator